VEEQRERLQIKMYREGWIKGKRGNVTKLLIPTHAHFHWLKFIKNI